VTLLVEDTVVGLVEATVEFAPVGGDLYRRGFAGDARNACGISGWGGEG
jgi:hypothetical protein